MAGRQFFKDCLFVPESFSEGFSLLVGRWGCPATVRLQVHNHSRWGPTGNENLLNSANPFPVGLPLGTAKLIFRYNRSRWELTGNGPAAPFPVGLHWQRPKLLFREKRSRWDPTGNGSCWLELLAGASTWSSWLERLEEAASCSGWLERLAG